MDFWTRLDAVRDHHDVLRHDFYQRWSQGELTRDELAVYSGEYHHAVVALAEASARTAEAAPSELREDLAGHAAEEAAHVDLWADFAAAVGGAPSAQPAPETAACTAAWAGDGGRDLLHSLVALYAIESAQPAISATKQDGLRAHYGIEDGPGTAYFALHAELDHEHAAAGRALIEPRLAGADEDALLATAEDVLRANWELLDGVERLNGKR
jgi:pyrroloquinoline-quinone synthase